MRLFCAVGAFAVLGASVFARADNFEVFDVNAVLVSGDALTGTMTLDTTTNLFTNLSATTTVAGYSYAFNGAPTQGNSEGAAYGIYIPLPDAPPADYPIGLELIIPVASPAGYAGSYLCNLNQVCGDFGDASLLETIPGAPVYLDTPGHDPLVSGSATLETGAATTPEPSSLVLLGSGMLGVVGAMRRRTLRSQK